MGDTQPETSDVEANFHDNSLICNFHLSLHHYKKPRGKLDYKGVWGQTLFFNFRGSQCFEYLLYIFVWKCKKAATPKPKKAELFYSRIVYCCRTKYALSKRSNL